MRLFLAFHRGTVLYLSYKGISAERNKEERTMKRFLPFLLLLSLLLLPGCTDTPDAAPDDVPTPAVTDEQPAPPSTEGWEPLTEAELEQAREALVSAAYDPDTGRTDATEISCFFTAYYDRVEELPLKNFLRYYPRGEQLQGDNAHDRAEFEALQQLEDFPFRPEEGGISSLDSMPVPVKRYPRAVVDATLQKYAGITIADLTDTEGVLYLPEYDAYYNYTSDWGPGTFQPEGGERSDGAVRLWQCVGPAEGRQYEVLTLEQADGAWLIRSYRAEDPA